ncbi:MAG: saccharopine dehydrogenase C-terminal domain-containing protein [Bacteroidia bacterium]|nr:saccharopine dehydrogenase NADP-binding domain-containing protein [Bacteroidia bacterium]MDW8014452.1 saccharopine dehydrogenase C-terminal domain-containing protein [Bacteroidia bacterium]
MKPSVLVLGAGRMGRAIALDLGDRCAVTVADYDPERLSLLQKEMPSLQTYCIDFADTHSLEEVAEPNSLVLSAVPGDIGFLVLQTLVQMGKRVVDISFFPEEPFSLERIAKEKGAIAIVDAGVAPGLSNLLLGRHLLEMSVESYECFVGGLPVERQWPYQYKAPFSPADVIEEYRRPVRQRIGGQEIVKPPLSEVELFEVPEIGTLEAFNTDGLRTLLHTTSVPNMREKTLRYPGHAESILILQESGFFSEELISVGGTQVRPIEVTLALLSRQWILKPSEKDILIMCVRIVGKKEGQLLQYEYWLKEEADLSRQISAMARCTAYTATALASYLLDRASVESGIFAPEQIAGKEGAFDFVIKYLSERGVNIERRVKELSGSQKIF